MIVGAAIALCAVLAGLWLGREAFQRSIPPVQAPPSFSMPEPTAAQPSPDVYGLWGIDGTDEEDER